MMAGKNHPRIMFARRGWNPAEWGYEPCESSGLDELVTAGLYQVILSCGGFLIDGGYGCDKRVGR
jgi:hypothetical protein